MMTIIKAYLFQPFLFVLLTPQKNTIIQFNILSRLECPGTSLSLHDGASHKRQAQNIFSWKKLRKLC